MGVSALDICINIAICCRSERGTFILPDFPPGDPRAPGLAQSASDVKSEPETALVSPEVTVGVGVDGVTDVEDVVVVVLETEQNL